MGRVFDLINVDDRGWGGTAKYAANNVAIATAITLYHVPTLYTRDHPWACRKIRTYVVETANALASPFPPSPNCTP